MSWTLAGLERFFERLFERPAARLFHTGVEPVQVRHRLERAMDAGERRRGGLVPDRYLVRVHPDNLAGLGQWVPEFTDALVARAHEQGYRLPRRPSVELTADPAVPAGNVSVDASFREIGRHPDHTDGDGDAPSTATMVFQVPVARVPYATLVVQTPGIAPREFGITAATVRIGRTEQNDLVIPDSRVSRQHGVLSARQGGLVYMDVGSTNGSFVNGTRVREVALGVGDVLRVGDSTVTVTVAR